MRKLKEFKIRIIQKFAQKYADFLITRMQNSVDQNEFEIWFIQGLYLDLWCQQKHNIYLD
jgi:hypothetical protein